MLAPRARPPARLTVALTLILAASLSLAARGDAQPGGSPRETVTLPPEGIPVDRYIVLLRDDVPDPRAVALGLAQAHGLGLRHLYATAVKGFSAVIPGARLAAVAADPRVQRVEPEVAQHIVAQTLPTGVNRIEADKNPAAGGPVALDVAIVAIIDTGILASHPDLNVAGGMNFSGGPSSSWSDGNGHGTHVAGTVGARNNTSGVVGVAPGAPVWAVKVCKNGGICMTGDMVAGIDWVAAQKAAFKANSGGINFAAANMSISTSDDATSCHSGSDAVHRAICGLVGEGVVFVLAAGNEGRRKSAYPEALTVAAIADFDGKGGAAGAPTCRADEDETLASFSNYGVDIAAPGTCILSTWNDGGYATISGTSMAAPHVTGAVALYLHVNKMAPATSAAGVATIRAAIVDAALPAGRAANPCSYGNERGTTEPLLFVNGSSFQGDDTCDLAGAPPPPVTDVAVTALAAPASVTQGSSANVDVTVTNVGNQAVTNIVVSLADTPPSGGTAGSVSDPQTIASLGAGASATRTFTWSTTSASPGTHTLRASHALADDNSGNNALSVTSTVTTAPPPPAGVTVTGIEPTSMVAGSTIGVTITGSGFATGAAVAFQNGSGPAPTASDLRVAGGGTSLTATVTVGSGGPKRPRVWDVRVTNPDGATGVLPAGFTVTP
jgi:subtilisin